MAAAGEGLERWRTVFTAGSMQEALQNLQEVLQDPMARGMAAAVLASLVLLLFLLPGGSKQDQNKGERAGRPMGAPARWGQGCRRHRRRRRRGPPRGAGQGALHRAPAWLPFGSLHQESCAGASLAPRPTAAPAGKPKARELRGYTRAEVKQHTAEDDLWLIIKNKGSDRLKVGPGCGGAGAGAAVVAGNSSARAAPACARARRGAGRRRPGCRLRGCRRTPAPSRPRTQVYDVTSYIEHHPGGDAIFAHAGDDCTTVRACGLAGWRVAAGPRSGAACLAATWGRPAGLRAAVRCPSPATHPARFCAARPRCRRPPPAPPSTCAKALHPRRPPPAPQGFLGIQHPPTVYDLVEEYCIGWLEDP